MKLILLFSLLMPFALHSTEASARGCYCYCKDGTGDRPISTNLCGEVCASHGGLEATCTMPPNWGQKTKSDEDKGADSSKGKDGEKEED